MGGGKGKPYHKRGRERLSDGVKRNEERRIREVIYGQRCLFLNVKVKRNSPHPKRK